MSRRSALSRRSQILTELERNGRVQVEALSRLLSTSEVTIRKDLAYLESHGKLVRRYGGAIMAVAANDIAEEDTISFNKQAIGLAAAAEVRDHSRILIDFGTTTTAMIPHLSEHRGLVIMTNSMRTAQEVLALSPPPTLLMTGGTWDTQTGSLQGQIAEQVLRSYDFDQLFIGCDGIDPARGTTTFNELLGLSQVMAESASEVIVVATSDKIGRRIPNLELPWGTVDKLITDADISDNLRSNIEQQGVCVIIARENKE